MPQRILVLGASGYIGQHLTTALSQQGHQVLAAARNTERLQKLNLPGVTCHNVDLNWPESLPALLEDAVLQINQAMEHLIRQCPEQYLWGYGRYKQPRAEAAAPAGPTEGAA